MPFYQQYHFHFTFLAPFIRLLFPLLAMHDGDPKDTVPSPMEHVPPDPGLTHVGGFPIMATIPPPPTTVSTSTVTASLPAATAGVSLSGLVPLASGRLPQTETRSHPEDPHLIRALQDLQLSVAHASPGSSHLNDVSEATPFNLMMLIADPLRLAAHISQDTVWRDLSNAWRQRVRGINEVIPNLFLVSFDTPGDMMAVLRNQPWTVRGHNVLLEIYDENKNPDDYRFQFMHVTARLYGLPRELRSEERIRNIIQQIGMPSDFHRLSSQSFASDPCYVPVKIKIYVNKPAVDKIAVSFKDLNLQLFVWVHYEKIKRICIFCAAYFHIAEHCPLRLRSMTNLEPEEGTFSNSFGAFGNWMTQSIHIPMHLVQNQIQRFSQLAAPASPTLNQLRQAFAARIGFTSSSHSLNAANQRGTSQRKHWLSITFSSQI